MKNQCGNGSGIVGHILLITGVYVLAWELIDSSSFEVVLKSPVFWGLILILGGFCSIAMAYHKMK